MNEQGKRFASLRKSKGMLQEELARKAGLSRSLITKLEGGNFKDAKQDTFDRLAKALDLTTNDFLTAIRGEQIKESPDQILERLRLATPISVPVYTNYPVHAGEGTEPVEYVFLPRTRSARRGIEAYIVQGECLSPSIESKDIIIVDRERQIDIGDIVAALVNGEMHLGRLRKIADELYLENSHGRSALKDAQVAAPVIEVVRRLK